MFQVRLAGLDHAADHAQETICNIIQDEFRGFPGLGFPFEIGGKVGMIPAQAHRGQIQLFPQPGRSRAVGAWGMIHAGPAFVRKWTNADKGRQIIGLDMVRKAIRDHQQIPGQ